MYRQVLFKLYFRNFLSFLLLKIIIYCHRLIIYSWALDNNIGSTHRMLNTDLEPNIPSAASTQRHLFYALVWTLKPE